MCNCIYCQRQCKNNISKKQHEIRCKNNPDALQVKPTYGMLGKKGENQYTKAKKLGLPSPMMTEETRKKLSESTTNYNLERWSKDENRKKQSLSMKLAVEKYPESYTSSNRGRAKQIIFDGIKFIGKWELDFYNWCKNNNIVIQRCTECFDYYWNGNRKYFPDFYLPEQDAYIEVKGYETERDRAKWASFPNKLIIIKKHQIEQIRKGVFSGL